MVNIFIARKMRRLEKHQFFTSMNYWLNIEIDNLPITNPIKRNLVRTFLRIKFTQFDSNFREYIKGINTTGKCCETFNDVMVKSIREYEELATKKGVPAIFLDKFRKWHESHIDITFDAVKSICESSFYKTDYEKAVAVLDVMLFSFRLTIVDAEKTINELNGELERALKGTVFDI